ncbi:unnamed protein product [Amoebophrya sp. A120]|nr:unnamed protein product [Amoebophrya sp. A120]|eukprot:GSA120T00010631001.1
MKKKPGKKKQRAQAPGRARTDAQSDKPEEETDSELGEASTRGQDKDLALTDPSLQIDLNGGDDGAPPSAYALQTAAQMQPESDDEGTDGYRKGGYHQVKVGEIYNNKYKVLSKLGWGHFSTVWLVQDQEIQSFLAMKVQKSAPHYVEAAFDEIDLLNDAAGKAYENTWQTAMTSLSELLGQNFGDGHTGVVQLIDYFEHNGANGRHICMVFEPMGPNVLSVIKRYNFKGIPTDLVRKITAHTLIGLDYLHRVCGIIHTDLKPENVLVQCPHGIPVDKHGTPLITPEMIKINRKKDFLESDSLALPGGRSALTKSQKRRARNRRNKEQNSSSISKSNDKQPLQPPPYVKPFLKPSRSDPSLLSSYAEAETMLLKPPYHHHMAQMFQQPREVPLDEKNGKKIPKDRRNEKHMCTPDVEELREKCEVVKNLDLFTHDDVVYKVVDLGNACWTHTHFSDDIQTRQYRSPEVMIGSGYDTSSDIWSLACMTFELLTGDYLFDPKPSDEYPRDEDHLALCIELLGKIPSHLVSKGRNGRTYFNRNGDLRHIKTLRYWGIEEVLNQKYNVDIMEARNLASFLIPMLALNPSDRVTAQKHLQHPWLRGLPSPDLDAHFPPTMVQPNLTDEERIVYEQVYQLARANNLSQEQAMALFAQQQANLREQQHLLALNAAGGATSSSSRHLDHYQAGVAVAADLQKIYTPAGAVAAPLDLPVVGGVASGGGGEDHSNSNNALAISPPGDKDAISSTTDGTVASSSAVTTTEQQAAQVHKVNVQVEKVEAGDCAGNVVDVNMEDEEAN